MRTVLTLFVAWLIVCTGPGLSQEPAPVRSPLLHFEPSRVEVVWSRDGWSLKAGDVTLKDFGRRNTEAAEALRLIRDLGLTERGVVGSPAPVLEYWLTRGEAPSGMVRGHRIQAIDLASVRVETDGTQWCVRDAARVLFNFGYSKDDAEKALDLIKTHRFGRLLLLGQGAPSMMVFLRDPSEAGPAQRHTMVPLTIKPNSIVPNSLRPVDPKKDVATREMAAIQNYATPGIPALRETMQTGTSTELTSMPVVPGVTDRITRVPFDWRQVQLRRDADGWALQVGSVAVARFGANEQAAQKAEQVVRHYRFNEVCLVGSPKPVCTYFTVSGKAPLGEVFGVPSVPIQIEQLKIQPIEGRYALVQGTETLLLLGDRVEDARQLLDWIQRQKVERLCKLTSADGAGIVYFIKR